MLPGDGERHIDPASDKPFVVDVVQCPAEHLAHGAVVLCSVRDPRRALGELARVLRPGGELRFLEHVASPRPARRRVQRVADATAWPLLSGGCHLGRDTASDITAAGFLIEHEERFAFRIPPLDPPKTHVLGRARR